MVSRSYLALERVMKWIKNVCSLCVLYPGDVVFTENHLILDYCSRICLGLSVDFQKQPQKKHFVVVDDDLGSVLLYRQTDEGPCGVAALLGAVNVLKMLCKSNP